MKNTIFILLAAIFMFSCNTNKTKSMENQETISKSENIYWINSYKTKCQGEAEQMCMLVQKGNTYTADNWINFYDKIEGFNYEPGFLYKVKIKEEKLDMKSVPAGGSSIKYTLIEVLEKNKVEATATLDGLWYIKSVNGVDVSTVNNRKAPQLIFDTKLMKYSGNNGCNQIFGKLNNYSEFELELGVMASTNMLCDDMEIADAMLKIEKTINNYKIEGNTLYLNDEKGNIKILLSKEK